MWSCLRSQFPGSCTCCFEQITASAWVAMSIYGAALLLGFGTSAAYHRLARTENTRRIMQRMDHSMIYVLIAGTTTPVALLGLPKTWGIPLLCVVWAGAAAGIAMKQFAFERFRFIEYALYPVLGWAAVATTPALVDRVSRLELALVVVGGVLYTAGIPVLLRKRPNPWPATFGYHEVWHSATAAAGACHFIAIAMLLR